MINTIKPKIRRILSNNGKFHEYYLISPIDEIIKNCTIIDQVYMIYKGLFINYCSLQKSNNYLPL